MRREFHLTPASIARTLSFVVAGLLLANLVSLYCRTILGLDFQFVHTFDFNKEYNIHSLYSAVTLLLCGLLMVSISNLLAETGRRWSWRLIGLVFCFLSVDELVGIHENLSNETQAILGDFNADGYLHFAWVVPYALLTAIAGIFLLRFFLQLPLTTRLQLAAAAVLFLAGALGMEILSGRLVFLYGEGFRGSFTYGILYTVEEILEMSGIIVLVYALTRYYVLQTEGQTIHYGINVTTGP